MTGPEKKLWEAIRGRRFADIKFRRQHPIDRYIVDFFSSEYQLVIELDGDSHNDDFEYDRRRQSVIEEHGYTVIRFDNDEVLKDLDGVLDTIMAACGIEI